MHYTRNTIWLLFALLMVFSLGGCSSSQKPGTQSTTRITGQISQRPKLDIPAGSNLKFESIAADKLPLTGGSGLFIIQYQPNFNYSNYSALNNLYPDTQTGLAQIDYTKNLAIIAYAGQQAYNTTSFQIKQVIQSGSTINILAELENDTGAVHSLVTTDYQVIKIEKTQLTQFGSITFNLFDQNGYFVFGTAQYVQDIKPVTTIPQTNHEYDTTDCVSPRPAAPVSCTVSLPQPPKAGDSAELEFILHDVNGIKNSQSWLEFYWTNTQGSYLETRNRIQIDPQDILLNGAASWYVDSPEDIDITLSDTIRFPKEGIWVITGFFYNNDKQLFSSSIQIAVKKEASINTSKIYGSKDFADIDNLLNGDGGLNDEPDLTSFDKNEPVLMELNLSKPPKAGEKVTLTCKIVALHHDIPNLIAHIVLWKYVFEHPDILTYLWNYTNTDEVDFYNSGTLLWQGSLQQNKPVEFSVVISIPESGNWQVYAGGDSLPGYQSFSDIKYSQRNKKINLTINADSGSYGYPVFQFGTPINGPSAHGSTNWIGSPSYSAGASLINVPAKKP